MKSLFIQNAIKIPSNKLEIFYINNFLDKSECQHLIRVIRSKLYPSILSSPDADKFFGPRTCDLESLNDEIVKKIDNKISTLLKIEKDLSEPIQGQYYEVGQEFKPHTDFFEDHELKANGGSLGQRSYTVMIYFELNRGGRRDNFSVN